MLYVHLLAIFLEIWALVLCSCDCVSCMSRFCLAHTSSLQPDHRERSLREVRSALSKKPTVEDGKIREEPLVLTWQINPSCSLEAKQSDRMSSAAPGLLVNYSSFPCALSPLAAACLVLCRPYSRFNGFISLSLTSFPPTYLPIHLCPFPRCQTQCTSTPQSFPKHGRRRPSLLLCYMDMCLWCR